MFQAFCRIKLTVFNCEILNGDSLFAKRNRHAVKCRTIRAEPQRAAVVHCGWQFN